MGFNFLVSVIAIVFLACNSTNHKSAQSEIVCRSLFSSLAARSGRSTMMYRLVSSAKRRMVISNSKGLTETLRDIRTSTYQS